MPISKKQVIDAIEAMPQKEFTSYEEIIEEIILLEKIEEGLADMKAGHVISEEEMNKEINTWFTK
jgi:predicted transcriptional regulator